MLKKISAHLCKIGLLSLCSAAGAGQAETATMPSDHKGFYVSGDLGVILSDQLTHNDPDGPQGISFNNFGLGGAVGYMFNPYIGLEGSVFGSVVNATDGLDNTSLYWYGAALKLNWPIGDHLGFFVKGGVGGLYTAFNIVFLDVNLGRVSANNVGGLIGGGFGYSIDQHSEISLETNGIIVAPKDDNGVRTYSYLTMLGVAYTYHF